MRPLVDVDLTPFEIDIAQIQPDKENENEK